LAATIEDAAGAERLVADGFVVVVVVVGWGRAETSFPSDMERAMTRMEVRQTILMEVVGVVKKQ
jgi:hypothetical protein